MSGDPISTIRKQITEHPENLSMKQKGYEPVFSASSQSQIVIIGQAPGIRAQTSGVPWDDKSGEQLRRWLGVTEGVFYDDEKIALVPMDFYFPGKGKAGDLAPRTGFAELWHPQLFTLMPNVELTLLIGQYAQKKYLDASEKTLTETVKNYKNYLKYDYFPLPHPSPRNNIWKAKNKWFEKDVVPALQKEIRNILE